MMFLPQGAMSGAIHQDESAIPSQEEQPPVFVPRVYGEDYSLEIFSSFTPSSFRDYLIEATEIGTRHALDATDAARPDGNNYKFRQWLLQKLNNISMGRLETQVIGKHLNVLGKLPGYLPGNNSAFVIACHYDSWYASIGANEGGSGIVVLLELIEKLSKYDWPLDIYFVFANSRYVQWGPFGSIEMADYLYLQGVQPLALYTLEALLVEDSNLPQDERLEMVYLDGTSDVYHVGHYWADLSVAMSKNYGGNRIVAIPHTEFNYWDYRYISQTYYFPRFQNTLIGIESGFGNDDSIRSLTDVWNNLEFRFHLGSEMTAAIGASIAFTMSREYGKPIVHEYNYELEIGESRSYYIPINAATILNVSSRWFGGNISYSLFGPNDNLIAIQEYRHTSPWTSTDIFSQATTEKGIHRLVIENLGFSEVGFQLSYTYDTDTDANGIMDSQEYWLDAALFELDDDGDTLSNGYEIILGTDPNSVDSDSDSLPDKYEVENGFNPTYAEDAMEDADSDSLSNLQEYLLGLDPFSADSDQDALPDGWEVEYGLNPFLDDANEDPDEDGRTNLQEYLDGTNPMVADIEPIRFPIEWVAIPSLVITLAVGFYAYNRHQERTWTEY